MLEFMFVLAPSNNNNNINGLCLSTRILYGVPRSKAMPLAFYAYANSHVRIYRIPRRSQKAAPYH